MSLLQHLAAVEAAAYPAALQQMQDMESLQDLEDYCEGKPTVFAWEHGYCLCTRGEIVDLAATAPLSLAELRTLLRQLKGHSKRVELDARTSTSWKLLQYAQRRGYLTILKAHPWDWDGEAFFAVSIRFA